MEVTDSDVEAAYEFIEQTIDQSEEFENEEDSSSTWTNRDIEFIPTFDGLLSGLQRSMDDEEITSPAHLFHLFINETMLRKTVQETNAYAAKTFASMASEVLNPREWYFLTLRELLSWLGLAVFNSLHPYPRLANYWSSEFVFEMRQVPSVMALRRFEQIKRFLHLDSSVTSNDPLEKIRSWCDALLENCKSIFYPSREIAIDEMVISFQGRCRFKSRIKYKRAGDGLLVYALCDSNCGYTFSFQFSFDSTIPKIQPKEGKLANAVYNLITSLRSNWHVVTTDNLYTSVRLAEHLYEQNQLFLGTCRANRGFPADIFMKKEKSRREHEQQRGTLHSKTKGHILAVSYYDNNPVHFISTAHNSACMMEIPKDEWFRNANGKYQKQTVTKQRPNVTNDYNQWMDGVDIADQIRQNYDSKIKSNKWWHAVFWWSIDTAISNAYIIHREECCRRKLTGMSHLQFRAKLAQQLIGGYLTGDASNINVEPSAKRAKAAAAIRQSPHERLLGMHLIRRIKGSRSKHTPERDCVHCKKSGVGRKRTVYECSTCNIGLHPDCFEQYHSY